MWEGDAMQVKEIMTDTPQVCGVNDSANEAARIMWERDCGAVPVVDRDGHTVGIVTDRDICMAAYFQGRHLSAIPIAEIMSRDLCTIEAEADLNDAERLMQSRQIRRLPVVANGGHLIGILSLSDLARTVPRDGGGRQAVPESQEVLRTVEKVSQPRNSTGSSSKTSSSAWRRS
jgi:CBS domain-containing protein